MKKLLILLSVLALTLSFGVSAFAAKAEIDLNKKGSLTITMECSHGYRSNGTVELYAVADIVFENNRYDFEYTEAFKDCPLGLDNIGNDLEADRYYDYLTGLGMEGESAVLENGVAVYEDLPVGLYLVVQAETEEGFSLALPFFVTIPNQKGENWSYEVDASPKVEVKHTEIIHPPGIPETGQLKWPIPIMFASGTIICAIGIILLKRNKSR